MKSGPDFDRIVSSTPLNKQAGIVTGAGEHWEPDVNLHRAHWDEAPPKMRPAPVDAPTLTGLRFGGSMRVVGLLDLKRGGDHKAAWVVRCDCGAYETRKAKAIRNPVNVEDCCTKCEYTRRLLKREKQRKPHIGREDWAKADALKRVGER